MLYVQEKNYRLKDFCGVGDGVHSSIARQNDGVMYFTSKNFKPHGLDLSKIDFISESDYEKHFENAKTALIKPAIGDIVFGIIGTIGTPYVVRKTDKFGISSSVGILRPGKEIDPHFLYYYMTSSVFQMAIEGMKSGAAQGFLSLEMIKNLPLLKVGLQNQKKIAAILSAYDDLIENNKRRIALLENMAEEIYREWFVRFRFPGYQAAEFEKGIPKKWSFKSLETICMEIRDGVKKKDLNDDEIYLGLEHLSRKSIAIQGNDTAASINSNKLKFIERDILFGKIRPYLHKVALSHLSGVCSSDTIVIRPVKKIYEAYVLFTIFSDTFIDIATTSSKGTKMPRADWDFLKKLELPIPSDSVLTQYQQIFDYVFFQISNLLKANENLERTKLLLLPRLISGKLSIENLGIQFPPSMQSTAEAE